MILVQEAKETLGKMMDFENDSVATIWGKFKLFCELAIEEEEEREILLETGVEELEGENVFYMNFVRQFTVYEEDEYAGMMQLKCEFTFEVIKELSSLQLVEWSMDYGDLAEFFAEVEKTEGFQTILLQTPINREFSQEEV